MKLLRALSHFRIIDDDPGVIESQLRAFAEQLPRLYLILVINTLTLSYTHLGVAPNWLTIYAPVTLMAACAWRVVFWSRTRNKIYPPEAGRRKLRTLFVLAGVLTSAFSVWGLLLSVYGNIYTQVHVAFYMSIMTIACVSCLMQQQSASLLVTVISFVPFLHFLASGSPVLISIAVNFLLVAILMTRVMSTNYRYFTALVHSRQDMDALSRDNLRLANIDSLTGMANRRSFLRDVQSLVEVVAPDAGRFALGIIDLDGFKPVNDIYGHASGDRVLVEVGRRLHETLGGNTLVARLGGDEFGVVLQEPKDIAAIRAQGEEICRALQIPFALPGASVQLGASIGLAIFPDSGTTREELFERADYALYYAKGQKRGTAVLFSSEHDLAIRAQGRIEQELRQADLDSEMRLLFQPIVDVSWDRVVAFEALARWESPVLGNVSPDSFITAAERSGTINRLTEVLFAKALAAAREWPDDVSLSFNLSVRDIASPSAMARLRGLILRSEVRPDRIVAEITETALMHDFDQARDMLRMLRGLGVRIALDDFGTGFSSLSYVHRLPLDTIKIDRSFVAELEDNQVSRDIVRSINGLCRNLKLACVVEGVETESQLRILRGLGCTRIQGYLFGRPMTQPQALAMVGSSLITAPAATLA